MMRIPMQWLCALCLLMTPALHAAGPVKSTPGGAQYQDIKQGTGANAQMGDVATIHFIGWLESDGRKGRELYNTRREGHSVSFVIGADKVMPGWNEGVLGMRVGGKRLVRVPPQLAYGAKGVPGEVPANAPLVFVIDLVSLRD